MTKNAQFWLKYFGGFVYLVEYKRDSLDKGLGHGEWNEDQK